MTEGQPPTSGAKKKEIPGLDRLFRAAIKAAASDLHIKVGQSPKMRINSVLKSTTGDVLTAESAEELVMGIMNSRRHPEQGYRACLGVMRLGKRYSVDRLEKACERAIAIKSYSYKSVESILKKGLDKVPLQKESLNTKSINHLNIRGRQYYK